MVLSQNPPHSQWNDGCISFSLNKMVLRVEVPVSFILFYFSLHIGISYNKARKRMRSRVRLKMVIWTKNKDNILPMGKKITMTREEAEENNNKN